MYRPKKKETNELPSGESPPPRSGQGMGGPVGLSFGWWLAYTFVAAGVAVTLALCLSLASWFGNHPEMMVGGFASAFGLFTLALFILRRDFTRGRAAQARLRETNEVLEARVIERTAELARSHESTQRSEARLSGIMSSTMDAIISVDHEQKIILFNSAAEKLFRCPAKDALGNSLDQFFPVRLREQFRRDPRNLGSSEGSDRVERGVRNLCALRADGIEFPIEASVSRIEVARHEIFTVILRDTSERQRVDEALRTAEERFSKTFHASLMSIAISTYPEGLFIDVNQQFTQMLGYLREEVLGRQSVALGIWARAEQRAEILKRIAAGETVRDEVCLLRTKAGELRTAVAAVERIVVGDQPCLLFINYDITERIRAEESLRLFRTLVDESEDAFEVIDPETGRFIDVSEGDCAALGYSRTELLSLHLPDLDPDLDRPAWSEFSAKLRSVGFLNGEGWYRRKDGTRFPVEFNAKWVHIDRDYIIRVVRDTSERQRVLQAAARDQARFRFIFDSMPVGITWMERGNWASRMVNPAHVRLTGVPAEQCQRMDLYRLATHPEDRARHDEFHRQLAAGDRDYYRMEKRYLRPDGRIHWAELTVRVFRDPAGGRAQEISTLVDVTPHKQAEADLRESEERFRQLAENIQEVLWMTDPKRNTVLYVSPAYEAIWGRTCTSLYQSPQSWFEALHPEDRVRVFEAALSKQSEGTYDETYRVVRPDGSIRWIRDRAFPIRNPGGQVYRVVGTAEDITGRRKLEDQFRQAQKMEAIGTLAGGIAHDFNNMLTAIIGYTELAQAQPKNSPEVDEYLAAVLQAGVRARDLVRHILTFSRQPEQQRKPVQLQQVVAEAFKLLRATIPSTLEFELELGTDLPPVLADATQIHQVLMNLCTNAAHAMRDRPGRLGVRLEKVVVTAPQAETNLNLRPGNYVRLTVTDTGHGMDRGTQSRIFEPFFTTKAPGEGTGLGLSVVHGIMHSHDGAMTVRSQPNEGTTFQLYFPAHGAETTEAPAPVLGVPSGRGERILLVDDEKLLALLGQKMLERLNYTVTSKFSALEALDLVRSNPAEFDLVVTDLTMPGMTGTEFARALLELRPDLPIILTTGFNASLTEERVRAMGIRELLIKPQTVHSLGTAVNRALRGQKTT